MLRCCLTHAFALAAAASLASAQPIVEYVLPTASSGPGAITAGPDGNLWFTETNSGKIGRITPQGQISEFPTPSGAGTLSDIAGGPDGNLWFSESYLSLGPNHATFGAVGRITPDGVVTEFRGLGLPEGIVAGPDGNLWVADSLEGFVLSASTGGQLVRGFVAPVGGWGAIALGSDKNFWFSDRNPREIGRLTTDGQVEEFPTPVSSGLSVTTGPDGAIWFTGGTSAIGRITPIGAATVFQLPAGSGTPAAIVAGPDGNLWCTEFEGRICRMSPNGEFTEILIPTASSSGIAAGPDGNIWFTESDRIGRVDLASLCSGGPQQLCLQQAHFGVEVEWSASNINQSGQGQAKPMTADTGAFWFFQPSSIELVIKVLDGRAINGHFWVFYGALTNVGYTITVTDTTTGTFKKYVNPEGQLASVADTSAF